MFILFLKCTLCGKINIHNVEQISGEWNILVWFQVKCTLYLAVVKTFTFSNNAFSILKDRNSNFFNQSQTIKEKVAHSVSWICPFSYKGTVTYDINHIKPSTFKFFLIFSLWNKDYSGYLDKILERIFGTFQIPLQITRNSGPNTI